MLHAMMHDHVVVHHHVVLVHHHVVVHAMHVAVHIVGASDLDRSCAKSENGRKDSDNLVHLTSVTGSAARARPRPQ